MTSESSLRQWLVNRFYAFPAVAQWWARRQVSRTLQAVGDAGEIPFVPLRKPLEACRAALLTTGGIHLPNQEPFDMSNPNGDASYREIPGDVALSDLVITHDYYNHDSADRDPQVIFPLDHFRDLSRSGLVSDLASRHFGLMGHIDGEQLAVLTQETSPEIAAKLLADGVDFAFLTPAWGLCNRSVGLLARTIESVGIPTVVISITKDLSEAVGVPRAVFVKWPLGHPLGEPGAVAQQRTMIYQALDLLLRADRPGLIREPGYRWRRQEYGEPNWELLKLKPD